MIARSRRLRRYYLAEELVADVMFNLLAHLKKLPEGASPSLRSAFPLLGPLPADACLEGVCQCWQRRAFGFLFSSESFEEVPDGGNVPEHPESLMGLYQVVEVRLPGRTDEFSADNLLRPTVVDSGSCGTDEQRVKGPGRCLKCGRDRVRFPLRGYQCLACD